MTQTVILRAHGDRALAIQLISRAPDNACVTIKPEKRSDDQNRLMWAILSDVSRAKPGGRMHTPEVWKELFCHACGHAVQFEMGLNGQPFPVGFRTSRMTKSEMTDLIEFIFSWCAENGVMIGAERDAA